jgi:hypothetical protein
MNLQTVNIQLCSFIQMWFGREVYYSWEINFWKMMLIENVLLAPSLDKAGLVLM